MKNVFIALWMFSILVFMFGLIMFCSDESTDVDPETKRLCMEYALRSHEGEIAPLRWQWLQKFDRVNDPEFWYKSCINHILYPVAGQKK